MKHANGNAQIRVTIDDYGHETHEKTQNICSSKTIFSA
jgi:hypothetical protein